MMIGEVGAKTKVSCTSVSSRWIEMKRLLVVILVLSLLVVTGTLVSADGQTRLKESVMTNSRPTVSNITEAK